MFEDEKFNRDFAAMRPQLVDALRHLEGLLEAEASAQDILDSYLTLKRTSALAFQALLRANIPNATLEWQVVRETLEYEMHRRFESILPEWALEIPYNSATHRDLFSILQAQLGEAVAADYLRIITADAVHAERRVRELRELGLQVEPVKVAGTNSYILHSVEVDKDFVVSIARNTIRLNKSISTAERDELLSRLK